MILGARPVDFFRRSVKRVTLMCPNLSMANILLVHWPVDTERK